MHRADRRRVHIRIEPGQLFPDLRRPPARPVLLPDAERAAKAKCTWFVLSKGSLFVPNRGMAISILSYGFDL